MNKKALAISQVFMFLVMIITFAVIMLFGYKAIAGFLEQGQKVEFVQFKNDLESAVRRISLDYGSVRLEEFYLPPSYRKICFLDLDYKQTLQERLLAENPSLSETTLQERAAAIIEDELDLLCQEDPLACSVWEETLFKAPLGNGLAFADENVFLTPTAPVQIKVDPFVVAERADSIGPLPGGFICLPIARGKFSLQLKGLGDRAEINQTYPEI